MGAFLASVTAGVLRLERNALADEAYAADLGAWAVVRSPAWCTPEDVRAIRDATRLAGRAASVLDPRCGPFVARSLRSAPTVVRVAGVRRVLPNSIEAVLEVRAPVAAVRVGDARSPAWVEVDETGTAVGPPVAARPARARAHGEDPRPLREITGAARAGAVPGESFGEDVAAAADLSASLDRFGSPEDRALLAQLDRIDVSNFGGRVRPDASEVTLRPAAEDAAGSRRPACDVEWGRVSAADPADREPLFATKAARTVQSLRMFPGLDGIRTVRVAFEDLVVVPAAGSPLSSR